jgi:hypothetical protein
LELRQKRPPPALANDSATPPTLGGLGQD